MIVWDIEPIINLRPTINITESNQCPKKLEPTTRVVWDNEHFEDLEDVVAIIIKLLAGKPIALYCYRGDHIPNRKENGVCYVLERDPGMDIRTFIVWARGAAEVIGFSSVLGLHRTS